MENTTVEAIRQILIQLHDLVDRGLPPQRIDKVRREAIFFLYEGGVAAKWSFDRPHSKAARVMHRNAREMGIPFNSGRFPITYEHAIPLKLLREGLRQATESTEQMRDFLRRHVQGVVVLKQEDAALTKKGLRNRHPDGADFFDLMARYRAAGITFEPEDEHKLLRYI
ncbi:hypothetical protein IY145_16190 [Methylosinus sp. H3A]|uniref:hypothetical protein n=1 Tax=Methylosinus sp. H3A TaxID=2785786 RepID=UPI0018C1F299|nr:hypothetical protein [Methylosinus sp. H3A]MBG0810910.1 hypothetical protein [Methylosinus sp. H3A]